MSNVASTSSFQSYSTPSVNNTEQLPDILKRRDTASTNEDDVDTKLWNQTGLIDRPLDEKLCRHGPNAKCLHCTPLEPYDEGYLKEHKIKHMSFHGYLKKMTRGIDKGKFAFLEDISCRIKTGCQGHLPWPQGICTKCQPNAITLNQQNYRHIDNIVFENPSIVDRFLNSWRTTGYQRIGYLFGRYDVHSDVPLGIKAVVLSIYEPPQTGASDGIRLEEDPHSKALEQVICKLGLVKVGWIFTDLVPLDRTKGTVKCVRGSESHFLSAQECIMAGALQNAHPNPCRLSPTGFFGSKFVTVCVTGNNENQIHMEGYQVSNQCMALVRDNCLVPTKDAPELGYIKETNKEQFVPDVFYKEKDKFGNEVTKPGRPLPIEYLLVDVPASTPVEPQYTLNPIPSKNAFPIGNRVTEVQNLEAVAQYLNQFDNETLFEAFSDLHLLLFLFNCDFLPREQMAPLLEAVAKKDRALFSSWISQSQWWSTLTSLLDSQGMY